MGRIRSIIIMVCAIIIMAKAQLAGDTTLDIQPYLWIHECDLGYCNEIRGVYTIALDASWRGVKTPSGTLCMNNGRWVSHACLTPTQCAERCSVSSVAHLEYAAGYGVKPSGPSISFQVLNTPQYGRSIGGRVFFMEDHDNYKMFNLLNREFSVDVEAGTLECGLNGHIKFVEVPADGGKSAYPGNQAGASFGTGYCDASCPREPKFINGEANMLEWEAFTSTNSGRGRYGSCCNEVAIWEGNQDATNMAVRPCSFSGSKRCNGTECDTMCDKSGCDFNPYRMGNKTFFGPNASIDSTTIITVITQFITSDNTDTGDLVEIRRIYKKGNTVIYNSAATDPSLHGANSITDDYCDAQKTLFNEPNNFKSKGGLKAIGESFKRGMALTMGLWVDHDTNNLWLDSNFPSNADPSTPGVARGRCPITSGDPQKLVNSSPTASVKFSAFKYGTIGFSVPPTTPPTVPPTTPPTVPPTNNPTQNPTNNPTQNPTQNPTVPPTNPPTTPPTETPPTQNPTSNPTSSPNTCGAFNFEQSRVSTWHSSGFDYSQWKVTLSSPLPIYSLSFSISGSLSEYTQLTHLGGDAYTLADGRLIKNEPIHPHTPISFGYSKLGVESSSFTILSANCTGGEKEGDRVDLPNSSSSLSSFSSSLFALVVVALVCSYLL